MNAQTKKEFRLMAPGFGVALGGIALLAAGFASVLAEQIWGVLGNRVDFVQSALLAPGWIALFYGSHWMGTALFGDEIQLRTFETLLAQPRRRGELWRGKMRVLFRAVGVVAAAAVLCVAAVQILEQWRAANQAWEVAPHAAGSPIPYEIQSEIRFQYIRHQMIETACWCAGVIAMEVAAIVGLCPFCALVMRKTHFSVLLALILEIAFLAIIGPGSFTIIHAYHSWLNSDVIVFCLTESLWLGVLALAFWSARRLFLKLVARKPRFGAMLPTALAFAFFAAAAIGIYTKSDALIAAHWLPSGLNAKVYAFWLVGLVWLGVMALAYWSARRMFLKWEA